MDDVKDAVALGRQAVIWTYVWMIGKVLLGFVALDLALTLHGSPERLSDKGLQLVNAQGLLSIVSLLLLLIAAFVNGWWIHRMVRVTRTIGDGVSVTPGWAVGWFFVPVACLAKPFEAIREAWQVTIDPADWPRVPVPPLLRIWWALWLALGFSGYLASMGPRMNPGLGGYEFLSWGLLLGGLIAIAATIVWTNIVRHISRSQSLLLRASAFR